MKKIAIIGSGAMARAHLDVLVNVACVEVVGIYSRTKTNATDVAKKYGIDIVAHSIADLYRKTNADGVLVAVSETATKEVCGVAFAFGWKLLIEKPVGLTLVETEQISAMAKHNMAQAFVALNRRHYGSVKDALALLQAAGDGQRVITIHDQEAPQIAMQAGRDKAVTDQWHFANSIHLIDLFNVFGRGKIAEIKNLLPWQGAGTMVTHSVLTFESGDVGIYHSVWNAPGLWSMDIETSNVRVTLRPIETLMVQTYPSRKCDVKIAHDEDMEYKPGFFCQIMEFIKALNDNPCTLPDLAAYGESAQLVEVLYASSLEPCKEMKND